MGLGIVRFIISGRLKITGIEIKLSKLEHMKNVLSINKYKYTYLFGTVKIEKNRHQYVFSEVNYP